MISIRRPGRLPAAPVLLVMAALAAGCAPAIDPVAIADAQTATRVKTALVNDAELGGRVIEVRVARGVVTLSGRVGSQEEADRAVGLARAVPGVSDVRSVLQIGGEDPPVPETVPGFVDDLPEVQPNPSLLAVGAAMGITYPREAALRSRVAIGPLLRLGSGRGLGPAVAFDWFRADLTSGGDRSAVLSRVYVRPFMLGVSYTVASDRVSVSPSLVAGLAFNSLSVTQTGAPNARLPVEVENSLVWRPGVSVWVEMGRRMALNVSAGYLMTRLRVTVLEAGRLEQQDTRGDTALVHVGVAYKVF